jgi:hypothetical protein
LELCARGKSDLQPTNEAGLEKAASAKRRPLLLYNAIAGANPFGHIPRSDCVSPVGSLKMGTA